MREAIASSAMVLILVIAVAGGFAAPYVTGRGYDGWGLGLYLGTCSMVYLLAAFSSFASGGDGTVMEDGEDYVSGEEPFLGYSGSGGLYDQQTGEFTNSPMLHED